MRLIFFLIVVFGANVSFSAELICHLMNEANASTLKISYFNNQPVQLSLKSPGDDKYRPLNMKISVIQEKDFDGQEAFSVEPIIDREFSWENKEAGCFREVGTQWYFEINRSTGHYFVTFSPFFVKESSSCQTPRYPPQVHALDCGGKQTSL